MHSQDCATAMRQTSRAIRCWARWSTGSSTARALARHRCSRTVTAASELGCATPIPSFACGAPTVTAFSTTSAAAGPPSRRSDKGWNRGRGGPRGDRHHRPGGARHGDRNRTRSMAVAVPPGLEVLFGRHACELALLAGYRRLHRACVVEGGENSNAQEIRALAMERDIPVDVLSKWDMNELCDQQPHQGCALLTEPVEVGVVNAAELHSACLANRSQADGSVPPLVICLDQVADPRNLGAILRTAQFLRCDAVVVSTKNSAPLSPVVSKASAGALETLLKEGRLHSARQMPLFLDGCRDAGWTVLGADAGDAAQPARALALSGKPVVVVMGNEGSGLRTMVRRSCDSLVSIGAAPLRALAMPGAAGWQVDSLNVSVAAGILVDQIAQCMEQPPSQ